MGREHRGPRHRSSSLPGRDENGRYDGVILWRAKAAESAFGGDVDYAILVKIYGTVAGQRQALLQPRRMLLRAQRTLDGNPDAKTITSAHRLPSARTSRFGCIYAPLHSPDQRLLKQGGGPRERGRSSCTNNFVRIINWTALLPRRSPTAAMFAGSVGLRAIPRRTPAFPSRPKGSVHARLRGSVASLQSRASRRR